MRVACNWVRRDRPIPGGYVLNLYILDNATGVALCEVARRTKRTKSAEAAPKKKSLLGSTDQLFFFPALWCPAPLAFPLNKFRTYPPGIGRSRRTQLHAICITCAFIYSIRHAHAGTNVSLSGHIEDSVNIDVLNRPESYTFVPACACRID